MNRIYKSTDATPLEYAEGMTEALPSINEMLNVASTNRNLLRLRIVPQTGEGAAGPSLVGPMSSLSRPVMDAHRKLHPPRNRTVRRRAAGFPDDWGRIYQSDNYDEPNGRRRRFQRNRPIVDGKSLLVRLPKQHTI